MAEALFRREALFHAALADVETASAGVIGLDGNVPVETAVRVLESECGLDLSPHRARRLLATEPADLVLTLDHWVQARASGLGLQGRVELLGNYAGSPGEEVPDPSAGPKMAIGTRRIRSSASCGRQLPVSRASGAGWTSRPTSPGSAMRRRCRVPRALARCQGRPNGCDVRPPTIPRPTKAAPGTSTSPRTRHPARGTRHWSIPYASPGSPGCRVRCR